MTERSKKGKAGAALGFLAQGGDMGARIRAHDWANSQLGAPAGWPQSLRTSVRIMLTSGHPILIFWGPELICLYNDAFSRSLGPEKHPVILGAPGKRSWAEVWPLVGSQIEGVVRGEGAVWQENQRVPIIRHGALQEVYWTYSYNPIDEPTAANGVGGVLVVCAETTQEVANARRLRENEERLRLALSVGRSVGTWDWDVPNDRVYADERFCAIYGVSAQDGAKGAPISFFFRAMHPQDVGAVQAQVASALASGGPFSSEYRLLQADGTSKWVLAEGRCAFDASGTPARFPGVSFDITDRKTAELRNKALVTLTDRIRDIDDPAQLAFAASTILGETLDVSRVSYGTIDPVAETLTVERDWRAPGIETLAGTLSLRDYGSFIDDLRKGHLIAITDVEQDERTASAAAALTARSARAFVNVPLLEQGQLVAVLFLNNAQARVWSAEDLTLVREVAERTRTATERLLAGRALKDANDTLELRVAQAMAERKLMYELVQTADTFIQALDLDYRLLAINQAAADEYTRVFGLFPKVGDAILEVLAEQPEAQVMMRGLWARAFAGELFVEMTQLNNAEGETQWYERKFGPVVDAKGKRIGAYQFANNVTARVREQERLAQTEQQLRQSQKMEAIGQLTGGIAHDFNNLLAAISGSLEVVEKRIAQGSTADVARFLEVGRRSTRRAASLIQRLLAFARRQNLDSRPTDINKLVAGMEQLIRSTVGPDVQLEVVGGTGLWTAKVDAAQLESALLNLCINGRDAMAPGGGRLTIETANRWLDERAAKERDLPTGQYISICITDTGVGMAPDVIAHAFEPFFTTKPFGEGTGLGLSMVHGFAHQSGGQIRIYSEEGKGTTMCLYLPRYIGEAEAAELEFIEHVDRGAGEVVLVVDDEPSIRMLIMEVLAEHGYAGREADDGPAALRVLRAPGRIDLLITDLGLPGGMNGRQVAEQARLLRPELKVILITGFAENAVLGEKRLPPKMAIMTKPFQMSAIGNKIRELLEQ